MLSSIIRWYATRTKLHKFYGSLACNNYTLVANQCPFKLSILQCITLKQNVILHRNYSNVNKDVSVFLPLFPGDVIKVRPLWSTVMLLVNSLWLNILVKEGFNLARVTSAAKKAASKVSLELANQNYNQLEDLVDKNMLQMLKVRICGLNEKQREVIAMREEDIIKCQAAYLRMLHESTATGFKLELNLIITYIPNYRQINFDNFDMLMKLQVFVANYTFSRYYKANGNSDWRITNINVSS